MEQSQRIKEAREHAKMNKAELARATGMTKQAIGQLENGCTKSPKPDNLFKIANATGVNAEWLATDAGKMLTIKEETADYTSNIESAPRSKGKLPLISWVQAGDWCEMISGFEAGDAEEWYPCPVNHSEQSYILRVRGASMEPEYHHGDLIFIDPCEGYQHNSDVIVRLNNTGEATFKRLQFDGDNRFLLALNKDYPNPVIPLDDEAQICGVVVFSGRTR